MNSKIDGHEIQKMISHWMQTPVNGYLGSDYGQDLKSLLQRPHGDTEADNYLQKLKEDLTILGIYDPSQIEMYAQRVAPDKLNLILRVGSILTVIGE